MQRSNIRRRTMGNCRLVYRALSSLIIAFILSAITPFSVAQTLVLSQLSDRPKKDYKELRPMVEYAASQLAHLGITGGEVKLYSKPEALVAAMQSGKVHWVSETPYTASILVHEANAIPLLIKWKSGQRRYQTLIYTHKNSQITDIKELNGQHIAFEHDTSFSSYYLPRMIMEKEGLNFHLVGKAQDQGVKDKVNYLFSRNEKNNLLWVHKRIVNAGALNNGDWNNPKRVPESLKDDLQIIYHSDFYPRALELVSPKLAPAVRDGLRTLLLNLSTEKDGSLLYRYEKTAGFEEPTPDLEQTLQEIYSYRQRYTQ